MVGSEKDLRDARFINRGDFLANFVRLWLRLHRRYRAALCLRRCELRDYRFTGRLSTANQSYARENCRSGKRESS